LTAVAIGGGVRRAYLAEQASISLDVRVAQTQHIQLQLSGFSEHLVSFAKTLFDYLSNEFKVAPDRFSVLKEVGSPSSAPALLAQVFCMCLTR
jgi:secreted Zn-dependent insulinase-like peptidase